MHKGGLLFYSGLSDSSLVEGLDRGVTCHCLILARTLMTTQAPNLQSLDQEVLTTHLLTE